MENRKYYDAKDVDDIELEEVKDIETVEIEDLVGTEEKEETLVGFVVGCEELNIRKAPVKDPKNIACTVRKDSLLVIDPKESTNEWYSVVTESGIKGYCMKKYVLVSK